MRMQNMHDAWVVCQLQQSLGRVAGGRVSCPFAIDVVPPRRGSAAASRRSNSDTRPRPALRPPTSDRLRAAIAHTCAPRVPATDGRSWHPTIRGALQAGAQRTVAGTRAAGTHAGARADLARRVEEHSTLRRPNGYRAEVTVHQRIWLAINAVSMYSTRLTGTPSSNDQK